MPLFEHPATPAASATVRTGLLVSTGFRGAHPSIEVRSSRTGGRSGFRRGLMTLSLRAASCDLLGLWEAPRRTSRPPTRAPNRHDPGAELRRAPSACRTLGS